GHLLSHPAGGIAAAATDLDDAQAVAQTDAVEQRLGPRPVDLVEQAQAFHVLAARGQDVVFREVSHCSIPMSVFESMLKSSPDDGEPVHKVLISLMGALDDVLDEVRDPASFEQAKSILEAGVREHAAWVARQSDKGMTQLSQAAGRELQ